MKVGRLNIVFDGQFGSTGKGKLAAFLARKYNVDLAVANNMPNAGHTFVQDGQSYITFHLPAAVANPTTRLLIGRASAIYLPTFFEELEVFSKFKAAERLSIDPNVIIIEDRHRKKEAEELVRISSTTKGCGAALAEKIMRSPDLKQAKDVSELNEWTSPGVAGSGVDIIHEFLSAGKTVLAESAQGWGLSLNGRFYPYCTSRDVSPMQTLNDCGVSHRNVGDVYVCMRAHPIRVGNVYDRQGGEIGWSGPVYDDQEELTWAGVTESSGSSFDISETTTVTGKIRRVFSFSRKMYEEMHRDCQPDFIFLNFANYIDIGLQDEYLPSALLTSKKYRKFASSVEWKSPIAYVGTGAGERSMVDTMEDNMRC